MVTEYIEFDDEREGVLPDPPEFITLDLAGLVTVDYDNVPGAQKAYYEDEAK